jgi:hypothetical protein
MYRRYGWAIDCQTKWCFPFDRFEIVRTVKGNIPKKKIQIRLVSKFFHEKLQGPLKEQELPGVYSRVGVHLKWIKQIIAEGDDNEERLKQWVEV